MTQATVPYIPDNAPFSPEQREWLNGFLAGLFSTSAPAAAQGPSLEISIFFASQSGTAERLAKKMAKLLKTEGHTVTAQSIEKLTPAVLSNTQNALFFASTYGEGDPPDSARTFRDTLFADDAPRLDSLRYTVFCLGDRTYEQFCKFGIELDDRLHALGATRINARIESDVDVDDPFNIWNARVINGLRTLPPGNAVQGSGTRAEAQVHTRDNPFGAELVAKRVLTHPSSSKQTIHFSFDLADAPLKYEAGDACGVLAQNDPALVADILATLPFTALDTVRIPKLGEVTVKDALLHEFQINQLTRKTVKAFAEMTHCNTLNALLATDAVAQLDAYLYGRGLIDLLHEFPGVLTRAADLIETLPRLAPRLYSISSSPAAHARELHCTVGIVRYRSHDRERGGVASTMLADRVELGTSVPIYIQPNKRFRLPADSSAPIIMIGPGTGIAPFRAFLHERRALGQPGRNWLFFGERSANTDFLYSDELKQFVDDGHLTRLDTAFSRDQAHKVYVQDRMLEHGAELFRWLEDGASVYVCGDASRMAKDVDAALHRIVETHAQTSPEAAQEYIAQLDENHRYHRDVY